MIVGIDLDNTIINYDNCFRKLAKNHSINFKEKKNLKNYVKNQIIKKFSENYWTEMQGKVYGGLLKFAKINYQFIEFIKFLKKKISKYILLVTKPNIQLKEKKLI